MITQCPSPSPHTASPNDGTLYFGLFELIAVWGWEAVLVELAEVAHVRGDHEVATILTVVATALNDPCERR